VGGKPKQTDALSAAEGYLGSGYNEIAQGVFRSADNSAISFGFLLQFFAGPECQDDPVFVVIASDARPVLVDHAQVVHGVRVACVGGFLEPLARLDRVLATPFPWTYIQAKRFMAFVLPAQSGPKDISTRKSPLLMDRILRALKELFQSFFLSQGKDVEERDWRAADDVERKRESMEYLLGFNENPCFLPECQNAS
jgi:hypothetical protein